MRALAGKSPPKTVAQLGQAVAVAPVGDEHRHRHHVGEGAAGFFERFAEQAENLAHLAVEIAGQRFPGRVGDATWPASQTMRPPSVIDRLRIGACFARSRLMWVRVWAIACS